MLTMAFLRPMSGRCPSDSSIQVWISRDETDTDISKHQRYIDRPLSICKEHQAKHGRLRVRFRQLDRNDSRRFLTWFDSRRANFVFRNLDRRLTFALQSRRIVCAQLRV